MKRHQMRGRKPRQGPVQEAPVGTVWELFVNEGYSWLAVVVGEKRRETGNYPCVMLWKVGSATTRPGQRFNAAVTTARGWRRAF